MAKKFFIEDTFNQRSRMDNALGGFNGATLRFPMPIKVSPLQIEKIVSGGLKTALPRIQEALHRRDDVFVLIEFHDGCMMFDFGKKENSEKIRTVKKCLRDAGITAGSVTERHEKADTNEILIEISWRKNAR